MVELLSPILFFIWLSPITAEVTEQHSSGTTHEDNNLLILDHLLKNYDRRVTPNYHLDIPTEVRCDMYIRSLGAVSPATMDYEVDLYLRQSWRDDRMQSPNLTRPLDLNDPELVKKVWRPDVYFPNAKYGEFQYVTVPNVLVRISPEGEILYMLRLEASLSDVKFNGQSEKKGLASFLDWGGFSNERLKLTFSCMMNMERYPLDSQICTIELASFSKTTKEVELYWLNENAVAMYRGLKMAQFELKSIHLSKCKESFHIGEYSCLRAELELKRSIGHHLVQSYLPTILIVVISWVSFWLDVDAIPARITLGVTTLLTISSESSDQQSNLAPVSYVKALDVWMGTCTMFVFAALLEFTFVNYLARKKVPVNQQSTSNDERSVVILMTPKTSFSPGKIKDSELPSLTATVFTPRAKAKKIDQVSRVAFPVGFIIFNTMYWPYYLL